MRKNFWKLTGVLALVASVTMLLTGGNTIAADAANQYAGTWNGTWEGAGSSGRFDLTLTVGADGKMAGGVSVGQDAGDYTAQFSTLTITGNKLAGKYDFPPDGQGEIVVTATFEGKTSTGTWALQPKGQDSPMANGTWKVTKK